jgi:hypothetical protein
VTWAGQPDRRLLVAKGTASDVPDAADLAAAVDQVSATDEELRRYGWLLFEAAFGLQLWQQLIEVANTAAVSGRPPRPAGPSGRPGSLPCLELARRRNDGAGGQQLRCRKPGLRAMLPRRPRPRQGMQDYRFLGGAAYRQTTEAMDRRWSMASLAPPCRRYYRSESVNARHVSAGTLSVAPSRRRGRRCP